MLAEKDASGAVVAEYTHGYSPVAGVGTVVAAKQIVGGETYYQYSSYDHRGTLYKVTNENGSVVNSYLYNAWGKSLYENETFPIVPNRWRYQSNWVNLKDSGGKLVLSPSRLYSPEIAKFLQRDSIVFLHSLNLYESFLNRPMDLVDSEGSEPVPLPAKYVIQSGDVLIVTHAANWWDSSEAAKTEIENTVDKVEGKNIKLFL